MGRAGHIAFIVGGSRAYTLAESTTLEDAYERKYRIVMEVIQDCVAHGIPTTTFLLLPQEITSHKQYPLVIDSLVRFIDGLRGWKLVADSGMKFAVLGHWYNLPGRLVDSIKALIEDTKEHSGFVVNLCLNYDGRQEIVDAAKLMAHQVKAGKLDPDGITAERIKENIYTSSLPAPDIIVKTGSSRRLAGFLLWDSVSAEIVITGKPWQYFDTTELRSAIKEFESRADPGQS